MQRGKILFTSFDMVEEIDLTEYQVRLQIVRYRTKGLKAGFIHVPELAPSEQLFKKTMYKWKRLIFSKEEKEIMSKGKTGTWFDLYKIDFLKEMKDRKDLKRCYERLKEVLDSGKSIICICYCENAKRCHRSIIAEELKKDGYNVSII